MNKIDLVINTVGATKKYDIEHTRLIEYEANRLLIESAKKHGVKKYIMISNILAGITDGYLPMIVNAQGGGVLDYKLKAENVLRSSGLDYAIIRPGELIGHKEIKYFNFPPQIARYNQGNWGSIFSYIHRNTVAQTIVKKLVGNTLIPSKLTFELLPAEVQDANVLYKEDADVGEERINTDLYQEGYFRWEDLKADDENSIQELDHWKQFNLVKMYAVFFVAIGWNLLWFIPCFKMIFNKYWSNLGQYRLAIIFKVIMPLLLVLVVVPKYIYSEKI